MTMAAVRIENDIRLAPLTSWQTGGSADHLAMPTTIEELLAAIRWACERRLAITVLAGGTNVLVSDKGVRGLTIALKKFSEITTRIVTDDKPRRRPLYPARDMVVEPDANEPDNSNERIEIECLAGTSKAELLKLFLKNKLKPALFLAGLPGDVGGGVVMNAGVGEKITPREFVEIVDWVEVVRWSPDGVTQMVRLEAADLDWSYRHCKGWEPGIITRVGISWVMKQVPEILQTVRQANLVRAQKQPLDMPSCGSVFVNPEGTSSGREIEKAGLKGFTVGGAKVSEKHANFIVNFNRATAADIDAVIKHVQATVFEKARLLLKTEVVYIGEW